MPEARPQIATAIKQNDRPKQQENQTCPGEVRALLANGLAGLAQSAAKALPFTAKEWRPAKDTNSR